MALRMLCDAQAPASTAVEPAAAPAFGEGSLAPDAQSVEHGTAAKSPDATEPSGTVQEHAHDVPTPLIDDVGEPASSPIVIEATPSSDREAAGEPAQTGAATTMLGQSSFQRYRPLSFAGASAVLRQRDDDLAVPFFSEAEAAAYGRSSMDSYAMASCSSEALTTDLLISDEEDGARPRSGWPLMLRSRYGTPGQRGSGSDADAQRRSDESTADGSPRTAAVAAQGVVPWAAVASQLHPKPASLGAADAANQLERGAVLATELPEAPLREQPPSADGQVVQPSPASEATSAAAEEAYMPTQAGASTAGAVAQPSLASLTASLVEEGPAAEELGDSTAAGVGAEDEGPQWHMPRPSSNLPVAAIAARYSRSLTSPAAVSPWSCSWT